MKRDGATLLRRVRIALELHGDDAKARAMQAYMKSAMPCHGVSMDELRRLVREALGEVTFPSYAAFREAVRAMWRGARFREERYAVVELTGLKQCRPFLTLEAVPLYEELIVEGAWWDLVDELAAHRLGPLLAENPSEMGKILRAWARGDELWKRRAAIISQVRRGDDVDVELLFDCLAPSLEGQRPPADEAGTVKREFWRRKAIGWALREVARFKPGVVRRYLEEHDEALSGLSKREAMKGLARPARVRQPRTVS